METPQFSGVIAVVISAVSSLIGACLAFWGFLRRRRNEDRAHNEAEEARFSASLAQERGYITKSYQELLDALRAEIRGTRLEIHDVREAHRDCLRDIETLKRQVAGLQSQNSGQAVQIKTLEMRADRIEDME